MAHAHGTAQTRKTYKMEMHDASDTGATRGPSGQHDAITVQCPLSKAHPHDQNDHNMQLDLDAARHTTSALRGTPARWSGLAEELVVVGIVALGVENIAQLREEGVEVVALLGRYLQPHQDAPNVGAVVAVVEEGDVPAKVRAIVESVEEVGERARPLRELETVEHLMSDGRAASREEACVGLGQLVGGEVGHLEALLLHGLLDRVRVLRATRLEAEEDGGVGVVAEAVRELSDVTRLDGGDERAEGALPRHGGTSGAVGGRADAA
mmetsp:Transcript_58476/g.155455  ORF Transcript_58476/g.155455 Transcript_58476/m.155455 type:complete len:266 (+) Transcript_58476:212-1009(+)